MHQMQRPRRAADSVRRLGRLASGRIFEGWYVRGDRASQDRLRILFYNYSANVIANLTGGSFLTGLMLLMDADDAFMGLITMLPFAANMLQFLAPLLLERFPRRRALLTGLRFCSILFSVALVGLSYLLPGGRLLVAALSLALGNLIGALIGPGLSVWHLQSIPPNVRNPYYALQTMTVGVLVALCNLGASALVDFARAAGNEYAALLALRIFCTALSALETFLLFRVKESPYERTGRRYALKSLLLGPLRQKKYLKSVLVAFLWNFTCNIPGPYFTVYLLKDMRVSYTYLMLVNLLNAPLVLLLTPVWSRLVRRFHWFQSLSMAMGLYALHYCCLAFVSPSAAFLYPAAMVYAFGMLSGITLCCANVPYINIPSGDQTVYIGFYSTVVYLGAFLGVTLGQQFIARTEGLAISLLGAGLGNKQCLMLLTALLMAGAAFTVYRVQRTLPEDER